MISFLKRRLNYLLYKNLTGSKIILAINYNLHQIITSNNNRMKYIKNSGYSIKYGKKFRVSPLLNVQLIFTGIVLVIGDQVSGVVTFSTQ